MSAIKHPKKRNVPVGQGGVNRGGPGSTAASYFIKILLLGDTGVGKSSLMFRFSEGEFKSGLIGTAGVDYKMKNIELAGKSVKIQICDTAG
jgi:Ras-related protein Rab-8A